MSPALPGEVQANAQQPNAQEVQVEAAQPEVLGSALLEAAEEPMASASPEEAKAEGN